MAKLSGSNINSVTVWSVISSDTDASISNGYLIDASGGSVTLTLPASPSVGNVVGISDYKRQATTNIITIDRNSSNIEGSATDLIMNVDGAGFELVYTDATRGWVVSNEVGLNDGTALTDIVLDSNPQLGGDLDLNGHEITDINITASNIIANQVFS